MKRHKALYGLLLLVPALVFAQVRPEPGLGDPRRQTVMYDADQIVELQLATGYQLTLEFSPDERVENIAVGDSGAWQITPNKRGDHIFVKALQSGVVSNMTVITDARTYVFELIPVSMASSQMPFTVRFRYPLVAAVETNTPSSIIGRYKLSGARAIRPISIEDDGTHTNIRWATNQTIPATFVLTASGEERPVEGAMRNGIFVADEIADHLIFRLDRSVAFAKRALPKEER